MLGPVGRFASQFRHARRASGLLRTARHLYDAERLSEAMDALKQTLSTLGAIGDSAFFAGMKAWTRFHANILIASTASRTGETAVAVASIRDALSLWGEVRPFMDPGPTVNRITAWESWARRYLALAEHGEEPSGEPH